MPPFLDVGSPAGKAAGSFGSASAAALTAFFLPLRRRGLNTSSRLDCSSSSANDTRVSTMVGGKNAHQAPEPTAWKARAQCNWMPSELVPCGPRPSIDSAASERIALATWSTKAMTM